jgi:hypothetical protein
MKYQMLVSGKRISHPEEIVSKVVDIVLERIENED